LVSGPGVGDGEGVGVIVGVAVSVGVGLGVDDALTVGVDTTVGVGSFLRLARLALHPTTKSISKTAMRVLLFITSLAPRNIATLLQAR